MLLNHVCSPLLNSTWLFFIFNIQNTGLVTILFRYRLVIKQQIPN